MRRLAVLSGRFQLLGFAVRFDRDRPVTGEPPAYPPYRRLVRRQPAHTQSGPNLESTRDSTIRAASTMMKTIRAMLIVLSGLWAEGAFAHDQVGLHEQLVEICTVQPSCGRIYVQGDNEYTAWIQAVKVGDIRDVIVRWGWNHPNPDNAFGCTSIVDPDSDSYYGYGYSGHPDYGPCSYSQILYTYTEDSRVTSTASEIRDVGSTGAGLTNRPSQEAVWHLHPNYGSRFIFVLQHNIRMYRNRRSNTSLDHIRRILTHTHYNIPTPPEPDPPPTPPEPDPPTSREWCKAAFIPAIPPKREGIAGGSLRITNPDDQDVDIRVSAKNADGESRHVEESRKRIVAGGQIKIDLVEDEDESGSGWWSVLIESERDRKIHVTATARRGEEWLTLPIEKLPGTECSE